MRFLWAGPEVGHRTAEGICATQESPEVVPSSSPHLLTSQGLTPALPPTSPADRQGSCGLSGPLFIHGGNQVLPGHGGVCLYPQQLGGRGRSSRPGYIVKTLTGGWGRDLRFFFSGKKHSSFVSKPLIHGLLISGRLSGLCFKTETQRLGVVPDCNWTVVTQVCSSWEIS